MIYPRLHRLEITELAFEPTSVGLQSFCFPQLLYYCVIILIFTFYAFLRTLAFCLLRESKLVCHIAKTCRCTTHIIHINSAVFVMLNNLLSPGKKRPGFVAFTDVHGVNTPTRLTSSYQHEVTNWRIGKRCAKRALCSWGKPARRPLDTCRATMSYLKFGNLKSSKN